MRKCCGFRGTRVWKCWIHKSVGKKKQQLANKNITISLFSLKIIPHTYALWEMKTFCVFGVYILVYLNILRLLDSGGVKGLQCPGNPFWVVLPLCTRHKSHHSSWCKQSIWPAVRWPSSRSPSPATGTPPGCWSCRGWRCSEWSEEWRKKTTHQDQGLNIQQTTHLPRLLW